MFSDLHAITQKYPQMPPLAPRSSPAAAVTVMPSVWQPSSAGCAGCSGCPCLAWQMRSAAPFQAFIGFVNAEHLSLGADVLPGVSEWFVFSYKAQTPFERGHSAKVCWCWSLVKLYVLIA